MGALMFRATKNGRLAAALCLALLGGCGGGERSESGPVWMPSDAPPSSRAISAGVAAKRPSRTNEPPSASRAVLESVGEIELAKGGVQRIYRVRFRNGPSAQVGVVAQLVSAGSGATVIDGRVVIGDLAPGDVVTPHDTITLRHASDLMIDSVALHWKLTENGDEDGAAGALLRGAPDESAVAALRDYALSATVAGAATTTSPGARLDAVIERDATIEQVNAALRGVQSRIAKMRPGNRTVVLRLPDLGNHDAVRVVAERLRGSPAFESVSVPPPVAAEKAAALSPQAPADPEPDFNDHRDI